MIISAIRRHLYNRKKILKSRKKVVEKRLREIAEQEQAARSSTSLRSDEPILPSNLENFNILLNKGTFVVKSDKIWRFHYEIYSDSPYTYELPDQVLYRLTVRNNKKVYPIWLYHLFSAELLS